LYGLRSVAKGYDAVFQTVADETSRGRFPLTGWAT
jgi:hypothetical protein